MDEKEKYLTVKAAAAQLGLKPWQIHRAIAGGEIPSYSFHTKRKLVFVSEIRSCILKSRTGRAV